MSARFRRLAFGASIVAATVVPVGADEPPVDDALKAAALRACAFDARSLSQSLSERPDFDNEAEAVTEINELLPDNYAKDLAAFAKSEDAKRLIRFAEEARAAGRFDEQTCSYLVPLAVAVSSSGNLATYGLPLELPPLKPETLDAIRDNCEDAAPGMPFPPLCNFEK